MWVFLSSQAGSCSTVGDSLVVSSCEFATAICIAVIDMQDASFGHAQRLLKGLHFGLAQTLQKEPGNRSPASASLVQLPAQP